MHGALKCYTRECFASIGGVQERLGWDTIDETYARMRGFETRSFRDISALHHRPLAKRERRLRGRARHGECAYIAHFGLLWVTLRSVKIARQKPVGLSGVAFLYGYVARRGPACRACAGPLVSRASRGASCAGACSGSRVPGADRPM